ncbi:hypothetical protein ACPPVO_19900 [Dactylosporangium sp. McL0621]|uniref:hypothetical protein n=1 Tax=Dactylosporangium sp. McL0621 TaxID=3415678 RepID=UPI003CF6780E
MTHAWERDVDAGHLAAVRARPEEYAPGGLVHLVLEVVAYAADEAGWCRVTRHRDGSVSIVDDGRGTDTRVDERGRAVRKPVMGTPDLRFFDHPEAQRLPDGHPRRGISVVAALSEWLVHTNRRREGAWSQRYHFGIPAGELLAVPGDGSTGTTVTFKSAPGPLPQLAALIRAGWPELDVEVVTETGGAGGARPGR